jgi:hypothetical protein
MSQISNANHIGSPTTVIKATPILLTGTGAGSVSLLVMLPAMAVSACLHIFIVVGFLAVILINPTRADADGTVTTAVGIGNDENGKDKDADDADSDPDMTNIFEGNNPTMPFPTNDSTRIANITVTGGATNPLEAIGKPEGTLEIAQLSQNAPPAFVGIDGSAPQGIVSGLKIGEMGMMQHLNPGDIGGRSEATRAHLLEKFGGNKASEACVARGLYWLARHQSRDGYWAMDNFQDHVEFDDAGKETGRRCNCEGGVLHDNTAGTAFALLCFLGAGLTPENSKHEQHDYAKQIERGLRWMASNQTNDGRFVDRSQKQENGQHSMYNHAIATICMCEAASLYPKPWVRQSAQQAISLLVKVQDPNGGGWRYSPSPQPGDTSVVGWCIMALQSGRMAGLNVPATAFDKTKQYFDGCEMETSDGVFYGYQGNAGAAGNQTMTAVGLLSRMYLGWQRENPKLIKGVNWLRRNSMPDPAQPTNMYCQYYATQVMHHVGGDSWNAWNPKMRDLLIARQDNGNTPGRPHQMGSWSPNGDQWCSMGGRVMMTSLCILTLEVYYRHLPLYRAEMSEK